MGDRLALRRYRAALNPTRRQWRKNDVDRGIQYIKCQARAGIGREVGPGQHAQPIIVAGPDNRESNAAGIAADALVARI